MKNQTHKSLTKVFSCSADTYFLAALMIIGTYIRLHGASLYSVSGDEVMFLSIARGHSLHEVLHFSLYEPHPPLYYVLLHYWLIICDSNSCARLLSLLLGIATIPIYYAIGSKTAGRLTGLLCATLITFSCGDIIQSCLVRNYALFLFLLSCTLYSYLRWRDTHKPGDLLVYGFLALGSSLTHFSGILALACLGIMELALLLRQRDYKHCSHWIGIHVAILSGYIAVLYQYRQVFAVYSPPSHAALHGLTAGVLAVVSNLLYTLPHILGSNGYVMGYDDRTTAITDIVVAGLIILLCILHRPKDAWLKQLFFTAIGFEFLLAVTGIYPFQQYPRHTLWTEPFVICQLGIMLCALLESCTGGQPPRWKSYAFVGILIIFCVLHVNYTARYADGNEYPVLETDLANMQHFLSQLDDKNLIITDQNDIFQLDPPADPYAYFNSGAFTGDETARLMPYYQTHILFDQFHGRFNMKESLTSLLTGANRAYLDGKETLVFVSTPWLSPYIVTLAQCALAQTELVTFSAGQVQYIASSDKPQDLPSLLLIMMPARLAYAQPMFAMCDK